MPFLLFHLIVCANGIMFFIAMESLINVDGCGNVKRLSTTRYVSNTSSHPTIRCYKMIFIHARQLEIAFKTFYLGGFLLGPSGGVVLSAGVILIQVENLRMRWV